MKTTCYLAGPIEFAPNISTLWREIAGRALKDADIDVLVPPDLKTAMVPSELREAADYVGLTAIMQKIRRTDLRLVELSNIVLVHLQTEFQTCGTWEELFYANQLHKEIVVWTPNGKAQLSSWLFSVVPHDHIFDGAHSMDAALAHIVGMKRKGFI